MPKQPSQVQSIEVLYYTRQSLYAYIHIRVAIQICYDNYLYKNVQERRALVRELVRLTQALALGERIGDTVVAQRRIIELSIINHY